MKFLVISAAVLGLSLSLALSAVPASAQNMQGPGGQNYGAASSPQTGGIPSAPVNPQTAPTQRGINGLYNYDNQQTGAGGAPGDNNNGNSHRR